MRRPTFKRWIRRQCCAIANTDEFSFVKLVALAQSSRKGAGDTISRRRLSAALHLYALSNDCLERLHERTWSKSLCEKQARVESALGARDIERLALRGTTLLTLPEEYRDVLQEYHESYYAPELLANRKLELQEQARKLQLQTGTYAIDISKATGIAAPNVVAFLKHADVARVTAEGAESMVNYLLTRLPEE